MNSNDLFAKLYFMFYINRIAYALTINLATILDIGGANYIELLVRLNVPLCYVCRHKHTVWHFGSLSDNVSLVSARSIYATICEKLSI